MDELTELLKEAKPLYRKRKQTKQLSIITVLLMLPLLFINTIYQMNLQGENIYISLVNNDLQNELIEDEFGY